jgi:molybdenum cofactor synthesis domain-containing protein
MLDDRMSRPAGNPTAAIVVIGDEILSGKVEDENARYLVRQLRDLGVSVRRIEVIPDEAGAIVEAVREASQRHGSVFTSGGIGPTHDDLTLAAIATAFDMPLHRHPDLAERIRAAGLAAGAFHERDLRMADVPEGARLLHGDPPDPARWPVIAVRNVFVLPGVPSIFRRKFDSIRGLFRAGPIYSHAVYSREGEGAIAAALDVVVAEFPEVAIGSYPRMDAADHRVKITVDGRDAGVVARAADRIAHHLGAAVVRRE